MSYIADLDRCILQKLNPTSIYSLTLVNILWNHRVDISVWRSKFISYYGVHIPNFIDYELLVTIPYTSFELVRALIRNYYNSPLKSLLVGMDLRYASDLLVVAIKARNIDALKLLLLYDYSKAPNMEYPLAVAINMKDREALILILTSINYTIENLVIGFVLALHISSIDIAKIILEIGISNLPECYITVIILTNMIKGTSLITKPAKELLKTTLNNLLIKAVLSKDIINANLLLKYNANVNHNNNASLLAAIETNNVDMLMLLLTNGANIHARGDLALITAVKHGYKHITKLLVARYILENMLTAFLKTLFYSYAKSSWNRYNIIRTLNRYYPQHTHHI